MNTSRIIRVFLIASAIVVLLFLSVRHYMQTDREKEMIDGLTFACTVDGETVSFRPWKDEETGKYYLFLPSCFAGQKPEMKICYQDGLGKLEINHREYQNGEIWVDSGQEEVYSFSLHGIFGNTFMDKTLQVLISENLPAFLLETEAAEELLSVQEYDKKKYLESGSLMILNENGTVDCKEELPILKLRGNLTATLEKKPLTFSFESPISVCGMAPAVKWNLLTNAMDGAYIRNKAILDLANASMDSYQADGAFAEVYMNGSYQGMYLVTEAVEIAENRMEPEIADGWFLEMELDYRLPEVETYVVTDRGQMFEIKSKVPLSEKRRKQAKVFLNDVESALFSENGISTVSGRTLEELIDIHSWAQDWVLQEISGDHDTGISSQFAYTYTTREPVLYAGPVWDFDGSLGNVNTLMFDNPRALITSVENTRASNDKNQNRWLAAMYRHPQFQQAVRDTYIHQFRENLIQLRTQWMKQYEQIITRSAVLDSFRWHRERNDWILEYLPKVQNEGNDYRNYDNLNAYIAHAREFLEEKQEFLDELWIEQKDFCIVQVINDVNFPIPVDTMSTTLYYWVEKGTAIEGLPLFENEEYRFEHYVDRETGEIVENGTMIERDMVIEGIWTQVDDS